MGLNEQTKQSSQLILFNFNFCIIINEFLLSGLKQLRTWDSPLYGKKRVSGKLFKNIVYLYLELFFTIANSVDPGEMQHDVAFQF